MIGKLIGVIDAKNPPQVLVICAGIGYEVDVPMSTFYRLGHVGSPVNLLTHLLVREDAQLLYGFDSEAERQAFRSLIKISGIGARIALAILSGLSVAELARAIVSQDSSKLIRIPGVGKKTAERLLLELSGSGEQSKKKMPWISNATNFANSTGLSGMNAKPEDTAAIENAGQHNAADIALALMALGYSEKDAYSALAKLPADIEVNEGIRLVLQSLNR